MGKNKYRSKQNKIKREKDAFVNSTFIRVKNAIYNASIISNNDNIFTMMDKLENHTRICILNKILIFILGEKKDTDIDINIDDDNNDIININNFKKIISYFVLKKTIVYNDTFNLTHLPISECFPFYGFDRDFPTDDQEYFDDVCGEYFRYRNIETQHSFYDSINFSRKIGNTQITRPIYWLMKELLKTKFVPVISWALITSIVIEDDVSIIEEFIEIFAEKIPNRQNFEMFKTGIFYATFRMNKINIMRYCFDNNFMIPMDFMNDEEFRQVYDIDLWIESPTIYSLLGAIHEGTGIPICTLMKQRLSWDYIRKVGICKVQNGYTWNSQILIQQESIANVNFLAEYMNAKKNFGRTIYWLADFFFHIDESISDDRDKRYYGHHNMDLNINNTTIKVHNNMYVCNIYLERYSQLLDDDDVQFMCSRILKGNYFRYGRVQLMIILMAQLTNEILYFKKLDYPITTNLKEVKTISKLLCIFKEINRIIRIENTKYTIIDEKFEEELMRIYKDILERNDVIISSSLPITIQPYVANDIFYQSIRYVFAKLIKLLPLTYYDKLANDRNIHLFDQVIEIKNFNKF